MKIVKMEAWKAQLGKARLVFLDNDEDDEVHIGMALDQLQDLIDADLPRRGVASGSCEGKSANIEGARVIMDERMHLYYFADALVWGSSFFRRHYRIRRSLFLTILERVCAHDSYFLQKRDVCGLVGLFSRQKITSTLQLLKLGVCANAMDDYCQIGESTAMECM